ncbi:MAG: hypothetical protein KY466_03870 [Gemmatimonadetes bacterium]|nr:hypothetical protein [Gemmatimonadota bacterium]
MSRGLAAALVIGAALSALAPGAVAYRTGPPAGYTGGFAEPTCAACHWGDEGAVREPGALTVDVPERYEPGAAYDLTVRLRDPGLRTAGFQLSARFADGPDAGAQAGDLAAADSAVMVVTSGAGISYASHAAAGTLPAADGRAAWVVRWTAPAGGAVVFHVVANAGDDDASPLGDRIHSAEARSVSR